MFHERKEESCKQEKASEGVEIKKSNRDEMRQKLSPGKLQNTVFNGERHQ